MLISDETGPDPTYSTGVVGSVVPLTILAVVAFFYAQHLRQKAQPHMLYPGGPDPYKQRVPLMYAPPMPDSDGPDLYKQPPTSMYPPPVTSVSFTPYVSLLCSAVPGKPS
jgi:hypothetical protein